MIYRKETTEILARLARLAASGEPAALATVVRVQGSAYRRPGAKLLVAAGGLAMGSVSGGCLEADVREIALGVVETRQPRLRHYDTGSSADIVAGLGLGCNGAVDVFVQPASAGPLAELAERARDLLATEVRLVWITGLAGADTLGRLALVAPGGVWGDLGAAGAPALEAARRALAAGGSTMLTDGERAWFLECFDAPRDLLVVGGGDDARPLVAYAADAGFRVTVVDHRRALLQAADFPAAAALVEARPENPEPPLPSGERCLAVVKTHSLDHDREWLRRLLAADCSYVGLLGPAARRDSILEEIGRAEDPRVYGPVGLDLGADGAAQIAISIVAELLAVVNRRQAEHLAARRESIHAG